VNDVVVNNFKTDKSPVNIENEISVISGDYNLSQGGRYLFLLGGYAPGAEAIQWYANSWGIAKINDDGTITPIPFVSKHETYNVFTEFDGFTVEQLKEAAERARIWYEKYSK
jgi:hypothetical protein